MRRRPALLVLVVCLGGVLLLGRAVDREATRSLDQALSLALQAAAGPWRGALEAVSLPLDTWRAFLSAALLIGLAAWRAGRGAAVFVFAGGTAAAVLVQVAKFLYARPRPSAPIEVFVAQPSTASFPSGHVAWVAAFLGATLWVFLRGRRPPAYCAAGLVLCTALILMSLSRVYLGQHFATDVVAGALVGLACVAAAARLPAARGMASRPAGVDKTLSDA